MIRRFISKTITLKTANNLNMPLVTVKYNIYEGLREREEGQFLEKIQNHMFI